MRSLGADKFYSVVNEGHVGMRVFNHDNSPKASQKLTYTNVEDVANVIVVVSQWRDRK